MTFRACNPCNPRNPRIVFFLLVALVACDQNVAPPAASAGGSAAQRTAPAPVPPTSQPSTMAAQAAGSTTDSAAAVAWTLPKRWEREGQRPMRIATYRIPAAKGDAEPGELAVFFFGAGQGGDVQANLKRWYGQFEQTSGKTSEQLAKTSRRTVNGLEVAIVDLSGAYLASAGPMAPVKEKKSNYRLLGAIVQAPEGNVFFKFTGPAKTVAAAQAEFEELLKSLRKM